jgi:hypothetical protein
VLLSRASFWPRGDAAWVLVLIAGAVVFLFTRRRGGARAPAAVEEGEEGTTAVVAPVRRRRFWRPFLIVLGSLIALVLVTVAIFVAVFPVHLSRGVGNQTYVPTTAADLERSYKLGVGDLFLDLRNVRLPVGETRLTTRVDVGAACDRRPTPLFACGPTFGSGT